MKTDLHTKNQVNIYKHLQKKYPENCLIAEIY